MKLHFLGLTLLAITLAGCGKAPQKPQTGNLDNLLGWFALPGRDEKNQRAVSGHDTLIHVFKRGGTYYTICRGAELPLKECSEGLEWGFTPSSMGGTRIGFNASSNFFYIVINDERLSQNWQFYESDLIQPMTRVRQPPGLINPHARPPRTLDDFLGTYQLVWLPQGRIEIRKEGGRYVQLQHEFHGPEQGAWVTTQKANELVPLSGRLGFNMDREREIKLVYNDALRRFELVMTREGNNSLVRCMPLARVPASESNTPPQVSAIIGVPSFN